MSLAKLAAEWLDHCRAEGKLASTLHGYRYAMDGVLLPFCEREGITEAEELAQVSLDRLSLELLGRKGGSISKYTVDSYLRPVRHFLGWVRASGYDVAGQPALPRLGRPKPKDVLTREEIQRMEDACSNERDKLIVRVLGDTGMRIGEEIRLRPRDLIERNRKWFLYVRGKGERDRLVPVPRVWRRLQRWSERGRRQPCSDAIFVALRGNGFYRALGYSGAWAVVKGAAEMAGIQKRVYPHLLRHSLITHLRRKGYNDAQISMVVGNFRHLDDYTWMDASDTYGFMSDLD